MIKVVNRLKVYEVNGKENTEEEERLEVESHWNIDRFVVLKINDAVKITVSANDLIAAIKNATNTNK